MDDGYGVAPPLTAERRARSIGNFDVGVPLPSRRGAIIPLVRRVSLPKCINSVPSTPSSPTEPNPVVNQPASMVQQTFLPLQNELDSNPVKSASGSLTSGGGEEAY
jgi:hypothetical protein